MSNPLFLASLAGQPVCLLPEKAEIVASVLGRSTNISFENRAPRTGYVDLDAEDTIDTPWYVEMRYRKRGNLALVPVDGLLLHRESQMNPASGYTGYANIAANLKAADQDPAIDGIVLDISSPGGSGWGVAEAGAIVANLSKPSMAAIDYLCASAAYWLASQADIIVAPPMSAIGSIGAYTFHVDISRQLDREGVVVTFIHAGEHKVDGNETEPLPDDVREEMQQIVDENYAAFVAAVASGRDVMDDASVRATEAKVFNSDQALELGLIDDVSPIEAALDTFSQLVS